MRRSLLLFACLCMTGFRLTAQMEEFDFFPPGKMQPQQVTKIIATTFLLTDSAGKVRTGKAIGAEEYQLNKEGLITLHKYLPGYETLPKTIEITYGDLGRRTHLYETTWDQAGNKVLMLETKYAYSSGLKPSAFYRYFTSDTGLVSPDVIYVYEFDEETRISVEKIMASRTVEKTRHVIRYGEDKCEQHYWVTNGDSVLFKKVFPDDYDRIARIENTELPAELKSEGGVLEIRNKYDDMGLLREQETAWRKAELSLFKPLFLDTFQYDENGLLKEKISWQYEDAVKDFVPRAVVQYKYL